ncbi:YCF48-related protein [Acinetobacter sp. UBA6526]|uniref:YCF48-related protein n=1 Tax=Acinetobacter sp. UBA6526 TaxID=1945950 RepID=UPI00257E86C5|nr:YCF48-related protein [Acinetobacter sp. UBA6526]|tara:strand:+ start:747 stop:1889 length:1143 start_codon:yes stop_codon:yes gene_type:complete
MRNFIFTLSILLFASSQASASNFNYDTGLAAINPMANKALINAMDKIDDRIYAVGEHGIILYSDDDGNNWKQSEKVPFTNTLTDISCISKKECWASGHDATILHSNDYGKTWIKQYEDPDFDAPLLSIHMYDNGEGIAIGAFALSLRTEDGGNTWGYLFMDDDDFQPHFNYAYGDSQSWRKSSASEAYAVGEIGKYYISDDKGLNWLVVSTGYEGSYWSGIKVDEGKSLLLGMSGNLTLITRYGPEDIVPADKFTSIACYEAGYFKDDCKLFAFDNIFIGTKNSLTNAIMMDDGRIAISGNGGSVTIVDLYKKKTVETCVRSDRLSNTSIVYLGGEEFLLAGEDGFRNHSMIECYDNFASSDTSSQDTYYTVDLNMVQFF